MPQTSPRKVSCVSWIDAVGWAGSAILIVSLLQTRVLRLRVINLVGCVVLTAFNAIIQVWPMVGLNLVLGLINIYFIVTMLRTRHDERHYSVLEVDPTDAYLAHLLRVHSADIARYNPDFTHDPDGEHAAFLVLQGDETVGVVLVRDAGEGTAEVILDWVTPKHRDFSPGEFVYRDSGVFTRRGFTRVLSPAGMLDTYYRKIGFETHGDRFVLELAEQQS